jgi:hypothetical protein
MENMWNYGIHNRFRIVKGAKHNLKTVKMFNANRHPVLLAAVLVFANCCKITVIQSDCLYGRYACGDPCVIPPFACDSTVQTECDTVSILIDHDTWEHHYRAKDALPDFYYDLRPGEREEWNKGKVRDLGYSNFSGCPIIDSLAFDDTAVAKIKSIDYSQKSWNGVRILIERKATGDVPITVRSGKQVFSSVLHFGGASLTSDRSCEREIYRDKGLSDGGKAAFWGGITAAVVASALLWLQLQHGK